MSKQKTPRHSDKRVSEILTVSVPPDLRADVVALAKAAGEPLSALVTRALLASPRVVAYRMGRTYRGIVEGTEPDVDAAIAKMVETLDSTRASCEIAEKLDAELRKFQKLRRDQAKTDMARSGIKELVR
jgi:hypothetical protein